MDAQVRNFVISLVGCAVSGALLILLVPSLVESPSDRQIGIAGALGLAALAFGLTARRWRPTPPGARSR